MMILRPLHITALTALGLLLAGCGEGSLPDIVARQAAKAVVRPIIVEKLPGVPPDLVTECIIDNATAAELTSLASDAATGVSPQTTETVVAIAGRPEAIECVTREGLPLILNG